MRVHSFRAHTAHEMRRLSGVAHRVEGGLLMIIAVLAILEYLGVAWALFAWSVVASLAGAVPLIVIYALHPVSDWRLIWQDPQQRQHTVIAAALAVGAMSQLVLGEAGRVLWAVAVLIVGVMFLAHTQHGHEHAVAQAVRAHRLLGTAITAAGVFRLIEITGDARVFGLLWALALVGAAGQLLMYHEPPGAFESQR